MDKIDVKNVLTYMVIVLVLTFAIKYLIDSTKLIKGAEVTYLVSVYIAFVTTDIYMMYSKELQNTFADKLKTGMRASIRPTALIGLIRYLSEYVIPKQELYTKYVIAIVLGIVADAVIDVL